MPNIKGRSKVILQPEDTKVGIKIRVPAASSATANDGYIAYGLTVSGVATTIYDEDGNDVTSDMVYAGPAVTEDGVYVTIELQYPTTNGDGRYTMTHLLTLSDGGTRELDFSRIYAKDLK